MESKKQLVIIPPMSEALKKLYEVLEGISIDENIEVSIIDDLKELSQFVGSTGQCLILAANAKKCATFLQDNRVMLAKSHCKTILFTPKEIPAKTLVKFTKIGLTESILESLPPKTFLYKVKLLLRSIKTAKPQDEGDKLVKSLDSGIKPQEEFQDKESKEKMEMEENVIDIDRNLKKKSEALDEDAFDYSNPLKGKVKPQEESLDTHWKSNRKTDSEKPLEDEDDNMSTESEVTSIDMYYRGKNKRSDILPEEEGKELSLSESPTSEEEENRRKSSYADVIDEGSMKQKRLGSDDQEESKKEKVELIDLDLVEGKKKRNSYQDNEEETIPLFDRSKRKEESTEAKEKNRNEEPVDDLGGYLKGKINQIQEEEDGDITLSEEQYNNSEKEEDQKDNIDLLLEAGKKKKNAREDEESQENDPHDGEVDQIDNNMIGDSSTVDKIRTRMESKLNPDLMPKEDAGDLLELIEKKKEEKEKEDKEKSPQVSLELEKAAKEREALNKKEDEKELDLLQKKEEALLSPQMKEAKAPEEESESKDLSMSTSAPKEATERTRPEVMAKLEEEKKAAAKEGVNLDLEKDKNMAHTGQVDKIDTFYRSGEAKKKEQNWDNLIDKNSSLDLIPGKSKKGDNGTQARDSADLGEMTLDYRKLKEEFDMMSMDEAGGKDGTHLSQTNNKLINDEDQGSFRVVEIDPKSLDFSISIINSIYQKDIKAKQIFAMLAMELLENYHAYPVFYTYKLSDKKFSESYNTFLEVYGDKMPNDKKEWWLEKKKDTALLEWFQEKSMNTWRCPEIVRNNEVWQDVELAAWAENELKTKYVELAFPYFDGLDRMGLAMVFFPEGIDPQKANAILTVLEMGRTLFLDTIQRYQVKPISEVDQNKDEDAPKKEEKKNVLGFFTGLFGKKKAG